MCIFKQKIPPLFFWIFRHNWDTFHHKIKKRATTTGTRSRPWPKAGVFYYRYSKNVSLPYFASLLHQFAPIVLATLSHASPRFSPASISTSNCRLSPFFNFCVSFPCAARCLRISVRTKFFSSPLMLSRFWPVIGSIVLNVNFMTFDFVLLMIQRYAIKAGS